LQLVVRLSFVGSLLLWLLTRFAALFA